MMIKYGRFLERQRGILPVCPEEDGTVTTNEHLMNGQRITNVWQVIVSIVGANYGDKGGTGKRHFLTAKYGGLRKRQVPQNTNCIRYGKVAKLTKWL